MYKNNTDVFYLYKIYPNIKCLAKDHLMAEARPQTVRENKQNGYIVLSKDYYFLNYGAAVRNSSVQDGVEGTAIVSEAFYSLFQDQNMTKAGQCGKGLA